MKVKAVCVLKMNKANFNGLKGAISSMGK